MKKTIITVDDSASVRMMVNFTLQGMGYDIIEAENGVDAMEKLLKNTVHLIITDINMPEMDGIGLVRKVRAHPLLKFLPVIVLTTESQEEKRLEGKKAGATGWIVKPFNQGELMAAVRKVIE